VINGDCDRLNLADLKRRLTKTIVCLMNGGFFEPIYHWINNNNETNMKQPKLNQFRLNSYFSNMFRHRLVVECLLEDSFELGRCSHNSSPIPRRPHHSNCDSWRFCNVLLELLGFLRNPFRFLKDWRYDTLYHSSQNSMGLNFDHY